MDYTVTLEGADPDALFASTPDEEHLASALAPYAQLCGTKCNPSLCQTITILGRIQSDDVDNIVAVLIDAFLLANPTSSEDDFELVISSIDDDFMHVDGWVALIYKKLRPLFDKLKIKIIRTLNFSIQSMGFLLICVIISGIG